MLQKFVGYAKNHPFYKLKLLKYSSFPALTPKVGTGALAWGSNLYPLPLYLPMYRACLTYAAISRKNEDFETGLMTRRFTFLSELVLDNHDMVVAGCPESYFWETIRNFYIINAFTLFEIILLRLLRPKVYEIYEL